MSVHLQQISKSFVLFVLVFSILFEPIASVFDPSTDRNAHATTTTASATKTAAVPKAVSVTKANAGAKAPFSWDNATVYFVLTDRFYDGDPSNNHSYGRELDRNGNPYPGYKNKPGTFHGGDLRGLTKKLNEGYFTNLGVNAIWITSPIEQIHGWVGGLNFRHYAYHGYYALDFTEIDRNMGTAADLKTFIDTAHSKGIRILFDVVMNHAGYPDMKTMSEFQFGSLQSNWRDFYYDRPDSEAHFNAYGTYVNKSDAATWARWWGPDWIRMPSGYAGYDTCSGGDLTMCLADLPDFKTDSQQEVGLPPIFNRKWNSTKMAQEKRELDAFFKRTGKPRTPTNYMIKWITDWVREYGVDGFRIDTAKHVQLSAWKDLKEESVLALREWKAKNPTKKLDDLDFWMVGEVWGAGLGKNEYFNNGFDALINFSFKTAPNNMQGADGLFAQYASALNSDPSFNVLSYISSHDTALYNRNNLINAGTMLMLAPGAVQIYYGDESGRQPDQSPWDQPTRTHMNWNSMDQNILKHWQKLGQFRNRHLAIGAGEHRKLQDGPYAFSRTYDKNGIEDKVVVAIGASGQTTIDVSSVFEEGTPVRDFYTWQTATVTNGKVTVPAGANGVILLEQNGTAKPVTRVSASPPGAGFSDDGISVTLRLNHVASGRFSTDGSDPRVGGRTFTNGQQITVGAGLPVGSKVTLRMFASGPNGMDSKSFVFEKVKKPEGLRVFFKMPKNWNGPPQIYYYGTNPTNVPAVTWNSSPAMKPEGNDWFSYTIPAATSATIMFKDARGNQIPGRNQPGFARTAEGWYDGTSWLQSAPPELRNTTNTGNNSNSNNNNNNNNNNNTTTNPPSVTPGRNSAPTVASNLFQTHLTGRSVMIKWSPASDDKRVAGYLIYRNNILHSAVGNRFYFKDVQLVPGTTYSYRIRAIDDEGLTSPLSSPLVVRTPAGGN